MAVSEQFNTLVLDLLGEVTALSARRMFGGVGYYAGGLQPHGPGQQIDELFCPAVAALRRTGRTGTVDAPRYTGTCAD